jgi:hypothetical protein
LRLHLISKSECLCQICKLAFNYKQFLLPGGESHVFQFQHHHCHSLTWVQGHTSRGSCHCRWIPRIDSKIEYIKWDRKTRSFSKWNVYQPTIFNYSLQCKKCLLHQPDIFCLWKQLHSILGPRSCTKNTKHGLLDGMSHIDENDVILPSVGHGATIVAKL